MTATEPYRDPERPVEARLKDLLGRMTLEEKLAQLGGVWASDLLGDDGLDADRARSLLADGIGHVTAVGARTSLTPGWIADFVNGVQRLLAEETRLGIPALFHEETLAGYCASGAARYPQAIGLAATFHPEGVRAMAEAIRGELRAVGARQALAPVLDIARDPRWGRLEETFGEDPYLAGRFGVAYVRGLQGGDLRDGVMATARHFLGSGLPEGGLNQAGAQLGPRELREAFAEPFAAVIREADLRAVMSAGGAVDGVPCAASGSLLETLLRGELAFTGLVLADQFALDLLIRHHRVAADGRAAAALALAAGVDVETPVRDCFGEPLKALVEEGRVDMSAVDAAVRRVLRAKLELGLFEWVPVDAGAAGTAFDTPESRALARALAEQSMVLLKNDGVLPLAPGTRIALLGPAADDARLLLGDRHYPVLAEAAGRRDGLDTAWTGPAVRDAEAEAAGAAGTDPPAGLAGVITPLAALADACTVHHVRGCGVTGSDQDGIAEAVEAAREADVAVVCIGGRSGLTPDCTSGEYRDASDLRLTGAQPRLVAEVAATGTPLVLVVIGGRAFDLEAEAAVSNAVLMAWLPGEEGGSALARVLLGEADPAGRLPVTLARSVGQVPVHHDYRAGGGRSLVLGDYTDRSSRPLFPFGHGLSYTEFDYQALDCPDSVDVHATINVWVTLANAGARDGDEVVQVYAHDRVADTARPLRRLVGFKRVAIPAGATRRLKFVLDSSQFAYYDRDMRYVVDPGEVELMVGASSRDVRLRKTVVLQGERRPLQQQQVVATQVEVRDPESP